MNDEIRCTIEIREDTERLSPGRLVGVLMKYNTKAIDRPEIFAPGSLSWPASGIVINRQHQRRIPRLLLWRGVGLRSASDARSCRPKAATAMNSRVGRLGGHSHDSRNLTFLFRSREATTHRVYLNEVDTPLVINRQHQRSNPVARLVPTVEGDKVMINSPLPDTSAGRDAAAEIRSGLFRGLSVEFKNAQQTIVGGVRRITSAVLTGAAIVDAGSYEAATVEVRAKHKRRQVWL